MALNISLTKRVRRRKLKSGTVIEQLRFVLNWRDPRSGSREQRFFERHKDAAEARIRLIADYDKGTLSTSKQRVTIKDAVYAWLDTKRSSVRSNTLESYEFQIRYIIGPLPSFEKRRELISAGKRNIAIDNEHTLLAHVRVNELTTRQIRTWHREIAEGVSVYSANKALMILKAALALAAEEYEFRPPAMPIGLQRRTDKEPKEVLTPDQVRILIAAASEDLEYGIYYAAPFLMGTRPAEQLGLLWDCVDFDANVIRIERIQLKNGSLSNVTKTTAGRREIPISPLLRDMLRAWKLRCPRRDGNLERVFPSLGVRRAWPLMRGGGGGPLIYNNFRKRIWVPAIKALGLPPVTPHSARHSFISILQAQGVEVGLVAKLAGHKNAAVTLSHYTHAMSGGQAAVAKLDGAISGGIA